MFKLFIKLGIIYMLYFNLKKFNSYPLIKPLCSNKTKQFIISYKSMSQQKNLYKLNL